MGWGLRSVGSGPAKNDASTASYFAQYMSSVIHCMWVARWGATWVRTVVHSFMSVRRMIADTAGMGSELVSDGMGLIVALFIECCKYHCPCPSEWTRAVGIRQGSEDRTREYNSCWRGCAGS